MAYRNKVFVSFDGDNDIRYYWLMCAWKQNDNISFNFFNAHDINTARDTSTEITIKRRLRERLLNAKVFVSLVGSRTKYLVQIRALGGRASLILRTAHHSCELEWASTTGCKSLSSNYQGQVSNSYKLQCSNSTVRPRALAGTSQQAASPKPDGTLLLQG